MKNGSAIVALDVGAQRVGVATAHVVARIASPFSTLQNPATFITDIEQIVKDVDATVVVMGLPRNLRGESTDQTRAVEAFANELKTRLAPKGVAIYMQDEALTSRKAEDELKSRRKPYQKADIDALAATYILEDFLATHTQGALT